MNLRFRFVENIAEEMLDSFSFFFLGYWERIAKLHFADRALEGALERDAGHPEVALAEKRCEAVSDDLLAGRSLTYAEAALLRDLERSGATRVEIWVLFLLGRWNERPGLQAEVLRSLDGVALISLWAWLVPATFAVAYLGFSQFSANGTDSDWWAVGAGAFLLVLAAVGDLYFRLPRDLNLKWGHVIRRHFPG